MNERPDKRLSYPAPSIVLGLGDLGLAVLERLGEDWETLEQAGGGASLKNLRLVHLRANPQVDDARWRDSERQFVEIARYTGEGDLPTLALDFVILRALGLIRYRNGTYQVAIPRDRGVVEVPGGAGQDARDEDYFARRRFFEWKSLSPDPITSVERLRAVKERHPEVDLFISPLVNRIRQGHSPRAVLGCVSRCRALAEGRDPSPWQWFAQAVGERQELAQAAGEQTILFERDWLEPGDLSGLLDGISEDPRAGWSEWVYGLGAAGALPALQELQVPEREFSLTLPAPFLPRGHDLSAPISPFDLLRVDWETTGWATRDTGMGEAVEFDPVEVSPFRLGLFDHDDCSRVHQTHGEEFRQRLRELAVHTHRGLIRMWVDLQRERVETSDEKHKASLYRANSDDALDQSLEILGELLVRPLISETFDEEPDGARAELDFVRRSAANRGDDSDAYAQRAHGGDANLPRGASEFLRRLVVEESSPENKVQHVLNARLQELGFGSPTKAAPARTLFNEVRLSPEDIINDLDSGRVVGSEFLNQRSPGLLELRSLLNSQTRELYEFSFLKEYRNKPGTQAPRLTVYVVGDMSEAFSRTSMRTILREVHAELLRAFGPIFESFREGFDRALSVVPILWMPHPADSFGGKYPNENRGEEAAIIESIQGVRRWVESVPRGKRCIPQVIINSRVTDNAVLSVWDSVRQTRDFLSFQIRSDLASDKWLRRTATAARGDDLFASFSCHEISFPAEKAREYLANRFARQSLARIKRGEQGGLPKVSDAPISPPKVEDLLAEPVRSLAKETGSSAKAMAARILGRVAVNADTRASLVESRFDDAFEEELRAHIYDEWRAFTRRRGQMDEMVDALRRETSGELGQTLSVVQKVGDRLIDEHASKGGLKRAYAGFEELHDIGRDHLRDHERQRLDSERICLSHSIPSTDALQSTREQVLSIARDKPDNDAMKLGLLVWAILSPVLGAPLSWGIAEAMELQAEPGVAEFLLGPLGPVVGGLLVFLPVFWLLRRHMNDYVERLQGAVNQMSDAVRRVVEGGENPLSSAPSIRSFMQARLAHSGALATRNYAGQVYERVLRDLSHAGRLRRSVDLQSEYLTRRAENLGVQFSMTELDAGGADEPSDDLSRLFNSQSRMPSDLLVSSEHLIDYYRGRVGGTREIDQMLEKFIKAVGGFENWRKVASMSDSARIMAFTRAHFQEIVADPVSRQFDFEDELRERLVDFVITNSPNIGFGAKFVGYEGLDPDGVHLLADSTLVLHPGLEPVFDAAKDAEGAPAQLQGIKVQVARVPPNAAYMLSLVQGIRPHSLRNLRRFESFHHRARMPDDRTFPLSGESRQSWESMPINHLTGYESLQNSINQDVLYHSRELESSAQQMVMDAGQDEPAKDPTSTGGNDE
ncbi:hypothetical protein [Bradymonas sediminis]|uniref:Uncharacterized protein n=1 Tax=Bradymonas sediminis TaxID=1548548 RepID=A0A2Z4FLF3_9DELT|nr:hypothetical protein [Bradymonas sediminis]AWV89752.1 hypothetical protein DN745_10545 [Bradymonas sediminis]TDP76501.1 hypothetical protein DFR33_102132 [Bradymonas sediminis]